MARKEFYAEVYCNNVPAEVLTPRLEYLKELHDMRTVEIYIDEFDDPTEGKARLYYYSKKAINDLRRMYHNCPRFQELIADIILEESKGVYNQS